VYFSQSYSASCSVPVLWIPCISENPRTTKDLSVFSLVWFKEHSTEPAARCPPSLGARVPMGLAYFETSVRFANPIARKASVFFVSLRRSRNHIVSARMKLNDAYREARSMRKSSSGHAAQVIERVLELSADAQITRRRTPKDSPAFHSLKGAIAAYGKTLALLIALQQREEFYAVLAQGEFSQRVGAVS